MRMTPVSCVLLLAAAVACADTAGRTPESVGAKPVLESERFPPEHRVAIEAAASHLRAHGEDPAEFFARVGESDAKAVIVLHLWHASAFEAENAGVVGNPGGKCRDLHYDLERRGITATRYWQ